MKILVINTGSSSIKYQLIDIETEKVLAKGQVDRIGMQESAVTYQIKGSVSNILKQEIANHNIAMEKVLDILISKEHNLISDVNEIDAVGHRIVHGGEEFKETTIIDKKVLESLNMLEGLAPLHMAANIAGVEACMRNMPGIPMVAVFDTAYHQTIPKKAFLYGLPLEAYKRFMIRRYGFHGTSHHYVANRAAKVLKKNIEKLKIISCHLGNGSSVAAIKFGKVIDTSMGFTPLEGLVMGTRCGDIDPTIVQYLMKVMDMTIDEVIDYLNSKSGVLGLSEVSSDFRDLIKAADTGNKDAENAVDIFCYRVKKYIGSYIAAMGNVDVIAFTGGIGENSPCIREMILSDIDYLDINIDKKRNCSNKTEKIISFPGSKVKIIVIPANEEMMIAKETFKLLHKKEIGI